MLIHHTPRVRIGCNRCMVMHFTRQYHPHDTCKYGQIGPRSNVTFVTLLRTQVTHKKEKDQRQQLQNTRQARNTHRTLPVLFVGISNNQICPQDTNGNQSCHQGTDIGNAGHNGGIVVVRSIVLVTIRISLKDTVNGCVLPEPKMKFKGIVIVVVVVIVVLTHKDIDSRKMTRGTDKKVS